ncbi:MAG: sensor histidine kinase [Velocimicrobium sp.]
MSIVTDSLLCENRYAHDEDEFINAWDEFQVLSNYIGIMNIRYNDKFIPDFDVDDRFMDYKIPRMLLQPIIENVIVHGYRNYQQDCKIDITGRLVDNHLEIIIRDYGEGIPTSKLHDMQMKLSEDGTYPSGINHIALLNIDCRIKSYYGKNTGISIVSSTENGTIITMKLGNSFSV